MNHFARHLKSLALAALAAAALQGNVHAQGTAFTYQGRLDSGGTPVTGLYDLQFNLYSVASGGSALTGAVSLNAQPVTNGLFTVTLDFGNQFPGAPRWLAMSVRTNGAGAFTTLAPRQAVTATPYAITAGTITGTLPTGQLPANVALTDRAQTFTANQTFQTRATFNDRVGIGTNAPQQSLHVAGGYLRVDGFGDEQATLGGDGAGGDVEVGSSNPAVGAVALYNQGNGDYMHLYAKGATFFGTISGDGSGLTSLPAGQLTGGLADALLSPNVALRAGGNSFTGNQTLAGGGWSFLDASASLTYPAVGGPSSPMIHMFASGTGNADRMVIAHSPAYPNYGLKYQDDLDKFHFVGFGIPMLTVDLSAGRVGVNNPNPEEPLHVSGDYIRVDGSGDERAYIGGDGFGSDVQVGSLNPGISTVVLYNATSGQGMNLAARDVNYSGTQNQLNVADNFFATVRAADFLLGHSSRRGTPGRALVDFTDTLHLNFNSDWANTFIGGNNVSVCTLTIRGGCDIAEPFKMSEDEIPKGAVVVIDENNPGHLKMSAQAHDRRVAGIISGANGVNTGVQLTQEGMFENGQNVALSGRVYVQADAAHGAIKPGDLLTTSDTPGHAMKVTDHTKAQGAILGKAMTALKDGKGFVLVLVSLQ